jgi:5-methylcytosine-specific restriction protein A
MARSSSDLATEPTFLFTWNPARWPLEDFLEMRERWLKDPHTEESWSSGNNKSIPSGARFFLVKQRSAPKGIVASGRTTSDSYLGPHWDGDGRNSNYNDLRFDHFLDPQNGGLPVDELKDLSTTLWRSQASGITIKPEIAQELELRWNAYLHNIGRLSDFTAELPDVSSYLSTDEGRQLLARHLTRERDPQIVRLKKESVIRTTGGLACEVCEFDFYAVYGDLGREFCECHHRLALNTGMRKTRLEDLAIICANCHRMIHRRNPMLTVSELRELIRQQSNKQ